MRVEGLTYRATRKIQHVISTASLKVSKRLLWETTGKAIHFREPNRAHQAHAKLETLKFHGKGRRCVILGTAPSVRGVDLSLAGDDYIMALNKAYELEDRIGRIPDAIVMTNPYAMQEYGSIALCRGWRHVFLSGAVAHLAPGQTRNLIVFDQWEAPRMEAGFFQHDAEKPLYHSGSVVHAALQIAVLMGFDEIVMVGVDMSFPKHDPHFYPTTGEELKRSRSVSQINQERMVLGLSVAKGECSRHRELTVVHCGGGDSQNPFPRRHWDELFNRKTATEFHSSIGQVAGTP